MGYIRKGFVVLFLIFSVFVCCRPVYAGVVGDVHMSHEKETSAKTNSWLGDSRFDKGLYGNGTQNPMDKGLDLKKVDVGASNWAIGAFASLLYTAASFLDELLMSFGGNIDQIVFGRVLTGYKNNYFAFELTPGNIYGYVATLIYNIFAWVLFWVLMLVLLTKFAFSVWGGSNPRQRQELKENIKYIAVMAVGVYIMPYVYDITLYIRDIFLKIVLELVGSQSDSLLKGFTAAFRSEAAKYPDNIVLNGLYLGVVCLAVYFVFQYVQLALSQLVYFIAFPFVVVFAIKDRNVLNTWLMAVFGAIITPVFDAVLLLIPVVLFKASNGGILMSILCAVVCTMVLPARKFLFRLLRITSDPTLGGSFELMAAGRMLGAGIGAIAGKAGNLISSVGDYKNSKAMNEELLALEESEGMDDNLDGFDSFATTGKAMSNSVMPDIDDVLNVDKEAQDIEDFDDMGEGDVSDSDDMSDEFVQGAFVGSVGSGFRTGFDALAVADERVADDVQISRINSDISGMNTELNRITSATGRLRNEKSALEEENKSDGIVKNMYMQRLGELQAEDKTLNAKNKVLADKLKSLPSREYATDEDNGLREYYSQQISLNDEKLLENANEESELIANRDAVTMRMSNRDALIRQVDISIGENDDARAVIQQNISDAKDNIQTIRDNASVRRSVAERNSTLKEKEKQRILDKYATISNYNSPEFANISVQRRAELERRAKFNKVVRSASGLAGGLAGATVGVAATSFGGVGAKAAGFSVGSGIGSVVGDVVGNTVEGIGEYTGATKVIGKGVSYAKGAGVVAGQTIVNKGVELVNNVKTEGSVVVDIVNDRVNTVADSINSDIVSKAVRGVGNVGAQTAGAVAGVTKVTVNSVSNAKQGVTNVVANIRENGVSNVLGEAERRVVVKAGEVASAVRTASSPRVVKPNYMSYKPTSRAQTYNIEKVPVRVSTREGAVSDSIAYLQDALTYNRHNLPDAIAGVMRAKGMNMRFYRNDPLGLRREVAGMLSDAGEVVDESTVMSICADLMSNM